MRKIWIGLSIAVAAVALPAQAGIKLTYGLDHSARLDMTRTIYVDDKGNYRRELTINGKVLLEAIVTDGVVYVVQRPDGMNGPAVVMRQTDLSIVENQADDDVPDTKFRTEVVDVGPETVAGYRGEHYLIKRWFGGSGVVDQDVIISTDARLAPVVRAEVRMLRWTRAGRAREKKYYDLISNGIILREDKRMVLDGVENRSIDPHLFELPGPVVSLDEFRKRFPSASLLPRIVPPAPTIR